MTTPEARADQEAQDQVKATQQALKEVAAEQRETDKRKRDDEREKLDNSELFKLEFSSKSRLLHSAFCYYNQYTYDLCIIIGSVVYVLGHRSCRNSEAQ